MKTRTSPHPYRILLAGAALATASFLMAGPSLAATHTVKNLNDSGADSLRAAIAASVDGDTVNFQPGLNGTITLSSGELPIGVNVTIIGNPGLTVSANYSSRIFNVSSSASASISGITITKGLASGAAGTSGESPDGSDAQGGGILNAGNLTLTGCTITLNTASGGDAYPGLSANCGEGDGGGIYNSGALHLVNCLVSLNVAVGGSFGGVGGDANGAGICSPVGVLTLRNCTVCQNQATAGTGDTDGNGFGGGISTLKSIGAEASADLVNCTIAENAATSLGTADGGGIAFGGPLTIMCCTISSNSCLVGPDANDYAQGGGLTGGGTNIPTVGSTIFGGNHVTGGSAIGPDVATDVYSLGFNLISRRTLGFTGWVPSDLLGVDPKLGPLQFNGVPQPVVPTMWLMMNSPAIDQGNSFGLITTDEIGQTRPYAFANIHNLFLGDGSDIGAVEYYPPGTNMYIVPGRWPKLRLLFPNRSPGIGADMMAPFEEVQVMWVPEGGSYGAGMYETLQQFVRLVDGQYMAMDEVAPGWNAFYRLRRLDSGVANPLFVMPTNGPATEIADTRATLNGTVIAVDNNTSNYFQIGTEPGIYTMNTSPMPLPTSSTPAGVSQSISALSPGTLYHYQMVVTDDGGSQYSGDLAFITTASVASSAPQVSTTPGPLVVSNSPANYSAVLHGMVNPEGGATYAWFYYYSDSSTGQTDMQSVGSVSGASDFHQIAPNLLPNTTYQFAVAASNSAGTTYGTYLSFTTAPPSPLPAVQTLGATGMSASSAQLNATVTPNAASCTVFLLYGTDSNNLQTLSLPDATSSETVSHDLFSLLSSTTYYYRIGAHNSAGSSYGIITNFTTLAQPAVTTLVSPGADVPPPFSYVPSLTPTFTWNTNGSASYALYLAQYPSGASPNSVAGLSGNPVAPFNLQPGTNYYWYIISLNSAGDASSPSETFYFQTPAVPTVQTLPATNIIGTRTVRLSGNVNPNNGTGATAYFEYGLTTGYGAHTTHNSIGATPETYSDTVSSLNAGQTYHFRIDASNSLGLSEGSDATFVAP